MNTFTFNLYTGCYCSRKVVNRKHLETWTVAGRDFTTVRLNLLEFGRHWYFAFGEHLFFDLV